MNSIGLNRIALNLAFAVFIAAFVLVPHIGDASAPALRSPSSGSPDGQASQPGARIAAAPFSTEGREEVLTVSFDQEVSGPVRLAIYTFHYPLHPELAPEPDTWSHERQMAHAQDVQSGRVSSAYVPDPADPRVGQILAVSNREIIDLSPTGERAYAATWKATHGRLFFKVVVGGEALAPVATMRVHCRHVDLRSVERLKESLELLLLPLQMEHAEVATTLADQVTAAYETGHGLRYMLAHHGMETEDLDLALTELAGAANEGRWAEARGLLDDVTAIVREKEDKFVTVEVERRAGGIRLTLDEHINGFSFATDPDTEVYLKPLPLRPQDDLHERIRTMPDEAAAHDPSAHAAMMGFDREELLEGAVRLTRDEEAFVLDRAAAAPPDGPFALIVIYGEGGSYLLTRGVE